MTNAINGKPVTPKQAPALHTPKGPSPAMRRALDARLDALLRKHLPLKYPKFRVMMEQDAEAPASGEWGPVLLYVAAAAPLLRRGLDVPDTDDADTPEGRRMRRNKLLLCRLVLRGIKRRGEGQEVV